MKKSLLALATMFAASSVFASNVIIDGPVDTNSIRVASYNIMASRMGDTQVIRDAIKAIDADIIGLQEVDNNTGRSAANFGGSNTTPVNQAKYIADELGMNFVFCEAIEFDGGKYGTAILSKHPIKLIEHMYLPNMEGKEQRSACSVEVNIPGYPAPIAAITTHLDHTDTALRMAQVRTLNDAFSTWQLPNALPIIIGDLNLTPVNPEYVELQSWFTPVDHEDLTYTAPSWNPDRKIDYILTSNAQQWDIENIEVPKPTDKVSGKAWHEIADHLPLIVDMKLEEK
ncbi:endonuclease/exonuclease/phosphatase family protein [Vibrio fluminensis]|uniref:endonuclease/exonuclease/phosphatase family protein n=1 Tax=Vibrio fluminensis TaxID=2783614 RepID=UPI001889AE05|nr:endonuclease/exonuclease/phosphatase family protein [Vibrio fluminensis]